MTRRTRARLAVIAALVVIGTATLAAVRVGALTGGSLGTPAVETVRIALPGRGGRLILDVPEDGWLAGWCFRRVRVERAGQPVIDAPLAPAPLDSRFGIAVHWIAAQGRDGPYVRLADPSGDILLDLRGFAAWYVTDNGGWPWLAAAGRSDQTVGHVMGGDGTIAMTIGQPLPLDLADDRQAVLLGRVVRAADGEAVWRPNARSGPAPDHTIVQ